MNYKLALSPDPIAKDPFAQYVAILGRGKNGSRSLKFDEARDAMRLILNGTASEMQIGAFLMLLRVQEEEPDELAGFVTACRESIPHQGIGADLDWSSYAGKRRQLPWFILSALALADAGIKVFMHGTGGHTPGRLYTQDALNALGIASAANWEQAEQQLSENQFAFMPLAAINPKLEQLIHLKPVLGLRSMINSVTRLMVPSFAPASLHSIFHPAYGPKHQLAAQQLGYQNMTVFKGDGGEIELRPSAKTRLAGLKSGELIEWNLLKSVQNRQPDVIVNDLTPLVTFWREGEIIPEYAEGGDIATYLDFAHATVTGTMAIALQTLGRCETQAQAQQQAEQLWQARDTNRL